MRSLVAKQYELLPELDRKIVGRLLANARFWGWVLPKYYWGLGKLTIGKIATQIARKLKILGIAIEKEEYAGGKPGYLPAKFPKRLAPLGNLQLSKLNHLEDTRLELAEKYAAAIEESRFRGNPEQKEIADRLKRNPIAHQFLRYPMLFETASFRREFDRSAKAKGIILGDWYKTVLFTKPEFLANLKYVEGSCPNTESVSTRLTNLPTSQNVDAEAADFLCKLLREF